MKLTPRSSGIFVTLVVAVVSGCGGSGNTIGTATKHSISGTVSGLKGGYVQLTDQTAGTVNVSSNGTFSLPNRVPNGTSYAIAVAKDPNSPPQGCSVTNASGTIGNSDVANITVTCTPASEELIASSLQGSSKAFFIDPDTGSLSPTGLNTGLMSTGELATVPSGKFLYELNSKNSTIFAYSVNSSTGTLNPVNGSPFSGPAAPTGVVIDPTGKFLYAASASGAIAYTIDQTTGALSLVTGSPFPAPMYGLNPGEVRCPCAATSKFLYYAQYLGVGSYSVNGFSIDPTTGGLTPSGAAPSTCCTNELHVAVNPTGTYLFLTIESATIRVYAIDGTTGALTYTSSIQAPNSQAQWGNLAVDQTGNSAYSPSGGSVYSLSFDPSTEMLSFPPSSSSVPTGSAPTQTRLDPSGKYLYVATSNPKGIWAYKVDPTTATLTAISAAPVAMPFVPSALAFVSLP